MPGSKPEDSYTPDYGPIPEGDYTIDPSQSNYDEWWKPGWGDNDSWGDVRTPIDPSSGTYSGGREGMYMHGGKDPGSGGCIDLTKHNNDFHKWLQKQKEPVPLKVDYPGYQSPYIQWRR